MKAIRVLSLALAVVLCLGLLPMSALAAGDFTITDGVLTKYNGPGGDVVIPQGVVAIGNGAFENCTALTIYGVAGSYAQTYVKENNIPFAADSATAVNPAPTAYQSTQAVLVDGKAVEFQCYALKDASGNMTNYIKLRDLADILNGSAAQFQVGWDGSVTITTKTAYTPNGSEGKTPFSGDRAYQEVTVATKVNGQTAQLAAFVLNDDAGGGYIYYKLRDLGQAIGFNVGWSADKGVYVETETEQTDEAQQTESCEVGKQYESANGYGVTINKAEVTKVKGVRTLVFKYTLENLTEDQYLSEETFTFGFTDGTISNQGGIYLDGMCPGEKLTKTFNLIVEDKELSYIMFDDTAEEEGPQEILSRLSGKMPEKAFKTHLVWYFDK